MSPKREFPVAPADDTEAARAIEEGFERLGQGDEDDDWEYDDSDIPF